MTGLILLRLSSDEEYRDSLWAAVVFSPLDAVEYLRRGRHYRRLHAEDPNLWRMVYSEGGMWVWDGPAPVDAIFEQTAVNPRLRTGPGSTQSLTGLEQDLDGGMPVLLWDAAVNSGSAQTVLEFPLGGGETVQVPLRDEQRGSEYLVVSTGIADSAAYAWQFESKYGGTWWGGQLEDRDLMEYAALLEWPPEFSPLLQAAAIFRSACGFSPEPVDRRSLRRVRGHDRIEIRVPCHGPQFERARRRATAQLARAGGLCQVAVTRARRGQEGLPIPFRVACGPRELEIWPDHRPETPEVWVGEAPEGYEL